MTDDVFSKIAASSPVNKQAALSSSKGFAYTPAKTITAPEWDAPPKTRAVLPNQTDLTGTRKGRLVVVGVLDAEKTSKHNRALWSCRCDCGRYVSRSAKAINNPDNDKDRCSLCRHTRFLSERHRIPLRGGTP